MTYRDTNCDAQGANEEKIPNLVARLPSVRVAVSDVGLSKCPAKCTCLDKSTLMSGRCRQTSDLPISFLSIGEKICGQRQPMRRREYRALLKGGP